MRKGLIYIVFSIFCLLSCKEEIIYELSGGKPILFSQELEIETRSGSLSSLNGKSFGVRGFKYDTKWESEEVLAKPDPIWQNVEVKCDASGICNYETKTLPIQTWEPKKNYAFFGYYPYNNPALTLSDITTMGSPTLTYILSDNAIGANNGWKGSQTEMYDVMYGSVIDANEIENSIVELPFKHCLYGVQVVIENFGDQAVTIEALSLQLTLKYRGIKVPMNGMPVERIPFTNKVHQLVSFEYISKNAPVTVNSTLNLSPKDISKNKHLLLIPQEEMTVEATVKIKGVQQPKIIKQNFPSAKLEAGVRYVFDIQFIGDHVNLIIIEGTAWTDKDSDIEFE